MDLRRIVWLASFPKSGNTWLRLLLANYFHAGPDTPVHINNAHEFASSDSRRAFFTLAAGRPYRSGSLDEWLGLRPAMLRHLAASRASKHFVKTHCNLGRVKGQPLFPPEVTAGAVYVYRNPFDVALSYARHLSTDVDAAIDRMANPRAVNRWKPGIYEPVGRWDTHIASWLAPKGLTRHVLRYEDMLADTERAMRGLLGFLGAPIDSERLRRAIAAASFETLQRQEAEMGYEERPRQMTQFFHSGTAGGWRDRLSPAQIARIRSEFAPTLERLYPDLMAETATA